MSLDKTVTDTHENVTHCVVRDALLSRGMYICILVAKLRFRVIRGLWTTNWTAVSRQNQAEGEEIASVLSRDAEFLARLDVHFSAAAALRATP